MELPRFALAHVHNPDAAPACAYGADQRAVVNLSAFTEARAEIASWPGYRPTPLVALTGLAGMLGLGAVHYKDEAKRFGLKSFKALGGAYAVVKVLGAVLAERHGLSGVTTAELIAGRYREMTGGITFAAATDGNHGRSVAWGAQMFNARCCIYLHAHVSAAREAEIARYGAEIVRVAGSYDDSVRACAHDAERHGWHLVADTSSGGGDPSVPAMVMQGYTVMVQEFLDQSGAVRPTHVFVPGGVGGIAAAVAGHLWELMGTLRPRIVVVEPVKADCIFRSIAAGRPSPVPGDVNTFMACLAAGEISPLAWPVLKHGVDDVLALPEEAAPAAMRWLAEGMAGDPPLVAGESGCASTAGLIGAAMDPPLRKGLGLTASSVIVVIGSEGATDAETYRRTVGRTAHEVDNQAA
jgi:diaminopropionate ammonia-lyase